MQEFVSETQESGVTLLATGQVLQSSTVLASGKKGLKLIFFFL